MPRVPESQAGRQRLGQLSTSAAPAAPAQRRASEAEFGIPQAEAVGQAADAFGRIAVQEQERQNEIRLMSADRELSEAENELLYGDDGALTKEGRNAFGVPDQALSAYQERYQKLREGLANDAQREAFDRLYQQRVPSVQSQLLRHETRQIEVYERAETEAAIGQAQQTVSLAYNQPEVLDRELTRMEQILTMRGEENGLPPEAVDQAIVDAQSGALRNGIARALDQRDYDTARTLLDQHGERMRAADREQVASVLREAERRQTYRGMADDIVAQSGDVADALERARSIEDDEAREAVRTRIRGHYADQELIENTRQAEAREGAFDTLMEANGDLDAIPDDVWAGLNVETRRALERRSSELRRGVEPVTDYNAYDELERLYSGSPQQQRDFANMDLLAEYGDQLSRAHLRRFMSMQSQIRQGLRQAADNQSSAGPSSQSLSGEVLGIRTRRAIVNDRVKALELDTEQAEGLRRHVQEQLERWQLERGPDSEGNLQQPTNTQFQQEIMDSALMEFSVRGTGIISDDTIRAYEITPENRSRVYATPEQIPDAEEARIRAELTASGFPLDDLPEERRRRAISAIYTETVLNPDAFRSRYSEIPPSERREIEASLRRNGRPVTRQAVEQLYNVARTGERMAETAGLTGGNAPDAGGPPPTSAR